MAIELSSESLTENGCIVTAEIRNLPQRNAINPAMAQDLVSLNNGDGGSGGTIGILRASGPIWCSGADTSTLAESDDTLEVYSQLLESMACSEIFWIAQVHAPVLGLGAALLATCPIVMAAESCWVQLPEVGLGIFPGLALSYLEPAIGARESLRLAIDGERLSADEARRLGLISRVVDDSSQLQDVTTEFAQRLAVQRLAPHLRKSWRAHFDTDLIRTRRAILTELMAQSLQSRR